MNESEPKIKLSYISGLRSVVVSELEKAGMSLVGESDDSVYVAFTKHNFSDAKFLRSVARAYLVYQGDNLHPTYISKHKSILGSVIEEILNADLKGFKTFKISCAGSDSPEVKSISSYIEDTYKLVEREEADLKIHIIKIEDIWEVGVQITPRPLSLRDYKVENMSGAMDPTIAFALNSFGHLEKASSYLNVFSGSATLLIEAGLCYQNLERLLGFDYNKKHLSLAMQNIKKAGLVQRIQLKEKNIFDKPDLGKFDVIASDLPFGMAISKDEDLSKQYQCFVEYCEETLNPSGTLLVYTSEYDTLKAVIMESRFEILNTVELKFMSSVNAYLRPKMFVCRLKTV